MSFLRKAHTPSAKKWLERLQIEKVPVLVCLTFGDKLFAEHMIQGRHLKEEERYPPVECMKHQVKEQLLVCFYFTTSPCLCILYGTSTLCDHWTLPVTNPHQH